MPSKLAFVNYVAQFFLVRLTIAIDTETPGIVSYCWYIQYFVVPLTGWYTDYIFLGKRHLRRISEPHVIQLNK